MMGQTCYHSNRHSETGQRAIKWTIGPTNQRSISTQSSIEQQQAFKTRSKSRNKATANTNPGEQKRRVACAAHFGRGAAEQCPGLEAVPVQVVRPCQQQERARGALVGVEPLCQKLRIFELEVLLAVRDARLQVRE